jgi:tetratricopeptide (TPR) repeat protein
LALLGNLLAAEGEHEMARELHEEALALREAADEARGTGLSLVAMAIAASLAGEPDRAWQCAERALALFERTDDGPGLGAATMQLGYLAVEAGRTDEAYALLERGLAQWMSFARVTWCASIELELATLDRARGDGGRALERTAHARDIFAGMGDREGIGWCEAMMNGALTPE